MDKVSIEIDLKNSKAKCNELDGQLEAAQTKIDTLTVNYFTLIDL